MAAPDYVLGYSEQEQKRLLKQASILRGWTERFFRAGGLAPGMRVLDLGCGMGDVSLLAADLVGPSGSVLGVDRDAAALDRARARVVQKECAGYVNFQQIHLDELPPRTRFRQRGSDLARCAAVAQDLHHDGRGVPPR